MTGPKARQRPADEEFDAMIASSRASLLSTVRSTRSPWWRRTSGVVLGAVVLAGGATATGLAIADNQPDRAELRTGTTVLKLGVPKPGDKYVNVTFTWRCNPGGHFALQQAPGSSLIEGDCDEMNDRGERKRTDMEVWTLGGGVLRARGDLTLTLKSNLREPYEFEAAYGARPIFSGPGVEGGSDVQRAFGDPPKYRVNEYGLTVGVPKIDTATKDYPDLIPVLLNGREGYFRGDDPGYGGRDEFTNPDDYRKLWEEHRKAGLIKHRGKWIDTYRFVYAADGKTVLGKLVSGSGKDG